MRCFVCGSEKIYHTYHLSPFFDNISLCEKCYKEVATISRKAETVRKFEEKISEIPPKRANEFKRGDILYRDVLLRPKPIGLPAFGTYTIYLDVIDFKNEYLILPKGRETPSASLESIDRIVPQRVKIPKGLKEGEIIIVNAVQLKHSVPARIIYYKDGKFYETNLRWWGWLGFRGTPEWEDENYYYIPTNW